MNHQTIKNNRLADALASPDYCICLHHLKCTQRTAFVWKINDTHITPFTYEFDPDHYYSNGDDLMSCTGLQTVIPAYSIDELKRVFETFNYTVSKENSIYQLHISGTVENKNISCIVMNEREANAFAAVLIDLLQKQLLPLEYINERLRHD